MGLNISGLVIDKNYKENITELESIIGETLLFEKEVMFEDSCESFKEDDYCDIYYSEKGTFVLMSMERGGFEFIAKAQDTFSFVLSEMTMTFCINYVKKGDVIRTIVESEDETMEDKGTPFDFEKDEEDRSELIYHLIQKTLGESFYEIELDAKCLRYSFKKTEQTTKPTEPVMSTHRSEKKKPWWKIW